MDARLQVLLDKQEIEEVVTRYCRGIDRRDLELVRSCYHPDATDHHGSFAGGVDDYLDWVDGLLERYRFSMHLVGQIVVDLGAEPDLAVAETTGVSIHRSDDPKPYLSLATGFRYLDRFERRDGAWKIAARQAIGEWSIRLPPEVWWTIPESQLASKRDSSDPLYALLRSIGRALD